jgi:hypothetical protein
MRHVRAEKPGELFFRQRLGFRLGQHPPGTGYTDAQDNGHRQERQHFINFRANKNWVRLF